MPGLPLPHRSLQKDQKKVIYDTFKSFDKSAYKVYAVALIFTRTKEEALLRRFDAGAAHSFSPESELLRLIPYRFSIWGTMGLPWVLCR